MKKKTILEKRLSVPGKLCEGITLREGLYLLKPFTHYKNEKLFLTDGMYWMNVTEEATEDFVCIDEKLQDDFIEISPLRKIYEIHTHLCPYNPPSFADIDSSGYFQKELKIEGKKGIWMAIEPLGVWQYNAKPGTFACPMKFLSEKEYEEREKYFDKETFVEKSMVKNLDERIQRTIEAFDYFEVKLLFWPFEKI